MLLISLALGLVVAEVSIRVIERDDVTDLRPVPAAALGRIAHHYAEQNPVASGVDRKWFNVTPQALPRADLPVDLAKIAAALSQSPLLDPALVAPESAAITRVPPSEMFKAWNSRFIQDSVCAGEPFFQRFPGFALAFDPPEASPYPRYRFLAGITTPAGLVTNRFGWRGPDVSPDKPPGVVRLAFVGASTTVGSHNQPFSYPEFIAPWLNLWAEHEWPGVRFEVINAGREGVSSTDIAAIARQELVAAEPDFIIYYEGANQFAFRDLIEGDRDALDPPATLSARNVEPGRSRFAVVRRLEVVMRRWWSRAGSEPPKPRHRLRWPAAVDEHRPDPDSPILPLDLPRIVTDLNDIRATARRAGARLLVTSFVWMVEHGMVIDPVDHDYFFRSLNLTHWPATYAEIRRMADFQNRVLSTYARSRGIGFIDMAAVYPRDPRLFGDAVHRTPDGDRLHAWLLLQELVPLLRGELTAGRLPIPDRQPYEQAGAAAPANRVEIACTDFSGFHDVASALSLAAVSPSVPDAVVTRREVVEVITPASKSAYAAEIPIGKTGRGAAVIRLRLRVVSGRVAVGVLSRDRTAWLVTRSVSATREPVDVYLAVPTPADAGVVLVANAMPTDGTRSVVELEAVHLMRRDATRPGERSPK